MVPFVCDDQRTYIGEKSVPNTKCARVCHPLINQGSDKINGRFLINI